MQAIYPQDFTRKHNLFETIFLDTLVIVTIYPEWGNWLAGISRCKRLPQAPERGNAGPRHAGYV